MPLFSTLAALSQTAASNPPDGTVDAPSTIDDQLRLLGSFVAQLRDNNGFTSAPVPAGTLLDYAGATAPTGFLACDGSAVSRTTYASLFTAIGTAWGGGDGSTTFNVPDLRRRATIGAGGVAVAGPANTLGAVGGEETHVLTTAELAAHNHTVTITDATHNHALNNPAHHHQLLVSDSSAGLKAPNDALANGLAVSAGVTSSYLDIVAGVPGSSLVQATTTAVTANAASSGITAATVNAGSGTAHNNMQPSAVVNKIIKT